MPWIAPDRIFDGERLQEGLALRIEDGRVADLAPFDPRMGAKRMTGTLSPGFVDLQVNAGGGAAQCRSDGCRHGGDRRRSPPLGTVAILPTLITDAPEQAERAAQAALAARGREELLGLHLEGPHISPARRGTHAARFIRPLDRRMIDLVRRLRAGGVTVMITLAPEAVAPGQVAELVAMRAVVSLGHSDAGFPQVQAALAEGAGAFTHLFNAMSPLSHRAPGMVGAALASTVPAGLIADGIHVADPVIPLAFRARPAPDLTFLVSDAMPTVGGPDRFRLYDQEIRLEAGRLVNAEGHLAGAHLVMAEGVARLVRLGLGEETALRAAVTIPARLIGREDLARIAGRRATDLVRLGPGLSSCTPLGARVSAAASGSGIGACEGA
ncbi:N-acetylglucosamine 6-phosphate deacetylase [Rubellimicrobium thermophilum DSM 16684]|uniref:N-acetylglucosamine 6-phosphate deacetylase n=1 Tax=Rubellimicrobium thermophilum DSM 16684 TaxID=1123069 RepID=S9QZ22_9RHOB|nr:amidohydrolase family protein [Rubellimicrobium thermophilum]EPX84913.1 N-acetylglucosamine 6-phosphate deacetylase [Rubellimicrobium thermophilum DSM 16684]